jgi:hypothetical protein
MLTLQIAVRCKNPKCQAVPVLEVLNVASAPVADAWMKDFDPKQITCPACNTVTRYSQMDLLVGPLKNPQIVA